MLLLLFLCALPVTAVGLLCIGILLLSVFVVTFMYRVIHKSLRDFRPLRYSSRDGHAEGEHVNRGRDTPSFCPASVIPGSRDLLTSEGS